MTPLSPCADDLPLDPEPELISAYELMSFASHPSPLVFSSPHSGQIYSQHFLSQSRLNPLRLRRSEDVGVDALFTPAARACSAPLLRALFPRAYVDVNREPYELDPRMFDAPLPHFVNSRSVRVAAGLGTIPRLVDEGQYIYRALLPVQEIDRRLQRFYFPYHQALHDLIDRAQKHGTQTLLIDCHSMPSATAQHHDQNFKADIVLGDRYGTSCNSDITALLEQSLRNSGYHVERNKPYAGGFITQHYGAPARGRHAIQIEINRALYMDETRLDLLSSFDELAGHLALACQNLCAFFNQSADHNRCYKAAE